MLCGPIADETAALAFQTELFEVPERLLEVVAGDLLVLHRPFRVLAFDPVGEAFVEIASQLLRDRLVGGIADEDVDEPEGVLVRERDGLGRGDKLEPDEVDQRAAEVDVGGQVPNRAAPKLLSDDGCALDCAALLGVELVDAGCEQRLDRRWDIGGAPVVLEHRQRLLDEQRVALGCGSDPRSHVLLEPAFARESLHQ